MNYYTIKIEKNKDKSFSLRDKEGYLLGLITVGENKVVLNGTMKVEIHVPSTKGEKKVF